MGLTTGHKLWAEVIDALLDLLPPLSSSVFWSDAKIERGIEGLGSSGAIRRRKTVFLSYYLAVNLLGKMAGQEYLRWTFA